MDLTIGVPFDLEIAAEEALVSLPGLVVGQPTTITWQIELAPGSHVEGVLPIDFYLSQEGSHPLISTFWQGVAQGVTSANVGVIAAEQGALGATLLSPSGSVQVFAMTGSAPVETSYSLNMFYDGQYSTLPLPDAPQSPAPQPTSPSSVFTQFLPSVAAKFLDALSADAPPPPPLGGTIPLYPSTPLYASTPTPTAPAPIAISPATPAPITPISGDEITFPDAGVDTLVDGKVNVFSQWEIETVLPAGAAEVNAADLNSDGTLHNLDESVLLRVDVSSLVTAGVDPTTLRIWTRQIDGDAWRVVPSSSYNRHTKVVEAWTDHFSQFGLGQGLDKSGDNLPDVKAFTSDVFTGSSQESVAIDTPVGNGGMSPNLSLSYNSATLDAGPRLGTPSITMMTATLPSIFSRLLPLLGFTLPAACPGRVLEVD